MKIALLIEDDENGLMRAKRCAPNYETLLIYNRSDLEWHWVKDYAQFCDWINLHGLPDILAFDHDLHSSAYELWRKHQGYTKVDINYDEYPIKTGYHCAQYLVDYCLDKQLIFNCEVYSHSMNSKGRENILTLLNNFKKHQSK